MSYNSRRGTPNQNSRRPANTNFVPGGQLTPQKGGNQQNQQRSFGTQPQNNKPQQLQQQSTQQKQSDATQQQAVPQRQQVAAQQPQVKPSVETPPKDESMENGSDLKVETEKKKWTNRKIPNKEKIKRRNARLSKLLQPKCALMVLHELVKNPTFNIIDYVSVEGVQYKAVVSIEGVEHSGFGKSKSAAKNAAAETAIKYIFRTRKISQMNSSEEDKSQDGAEKMDTSESEGPATDNPLPWQQVASFALYKLFNAWGETPIVQKDDPIKKYNPAKKMPDNAVALNPIMLVHQMYPLAKFEELPPTGTPPNCNFNAKCTVDDKSFSGSGSTKKLAKKNAAFQVCHKLLSVQYPPEVYTPA